MPFVDGRGRLGTTGSAARMGCVRTRAALDSRRSTGLGFFTNRTARVLLPVLDLAIPLS
jgi:hypothetical protein